MIIDCREWNPEIAEHQRMRVFLDGQEIKLVWYVDTDGGFLRTYDVLRDGKCHSVRQGFGKICHQECDFPGRDVSAPLDGVLSETLHGNIELRPFDDAEEGFSARTSEAPEPSAKDEESANG